MELNELILLAAAPIYAERMKENKQTYNDARILSVRDAIRLWEEVLKQNP